MSMLYERRYPDTYVAAAPVIGNGVLTIPRPVQMVPQHYRQQQQQQLTFPVHNFIYRDMAAVGASKEALGYREPSSLAVGSRINNLATSAINGTSGGRQAVATGRRNVGVGLSCCCVPTGCTRYAEDLIDPTDPHDAVRVVCSSPGCTVGRWMHVDCYEEWDRRAEYHIRCYEQDASHRFNMQAAQAAQLVLAGQLRMCICGKGCLRKDPTYATHIAETKFFTQNTHQVAPHRQVTKMAAMGERTGPTTVGLLQHLQQLLQQQDQQQQRMRSFSFSSTGSGSCSIGSSSSVGGGSSSCGYSSTSASPPLSPPRSFFPPTSTLITSTTPPPVASPPTTGSSSTSMRAAVGHQIGSAWNEDAGDALNFRQQLPQQRQHIASSAIPPSAAQITHQSAARHHHHHHHHHHESSSQVLPAEAISSAAAGVRSDAAETTSSYPPQPNARGNIFRHRSDLSVYRSIVPSARNAYCIQLDDDGPHGNNDTRKFLMHKLTSRGVSAFQCVCCRRCLPVYDEFPVVDGALFLSPRSYDAADSANGGSSAMSSTRLSVQVVYNRRMMSLQAVCLECLGQTVAPEGNGKTMTTQQRSVRCRSCRNPWTLGSTLVLGTMYTYDLFACAPCCADRRRCRRCGQRPSGAEDPKSFSDYSKLSTCVQCGLEDYHFVRTFDEVFYCAANVINRGASTNFQTSGRDSKFVHPS